MERLRRKGVVAPADWKPCCDKAFVDAAAFWKKARQFERLSLDGARRKKGFARYAPEVLPVVDGKRAFPAVWRSDGRVKEAIARMSEGNCTYCQSHVSSNHPGKENAGHVEHFQPKKLFPTLAYAWKNYFLGCGGCNTAKGSKWPREGYVRPDQGAPAKRFAFAEDGSVKARKMGDAQAEKTIKDLELNRPWLKKHRAQAIEKHLSFVRMAVQFGDQLSPEQVEELLVAPLSVFSAAINENVRRVWNEAFPGKKI